MRLLGLIMQRAALLTNWLRKVAHTIILHFLTQQIGADCLAWDFSNLVHPLVKLTSGFHHSALFGNATVSARCSEPLSHTLKLSQVGFGEDRDTAAVGRTVGLAAWELQSDSRICLLFFSVFIFRVNFSGIHWCRVSCLSELQIWLHNVRVDLTALICAVA